MALDEAVSVITLCSIGSANLVILAKSLYELRLIVSGQKTLSRNEVIRGKPGEHCV